MEREAEKRCRFRVILSEPDAEDWVMVDEGLNLESDDEAPLLSPLHPQSLSTLLSRLPQRPPPQPTHHSLNHLQPSLAPPKSGIHISTPFPPPPLHNPQHPHLQFPQIPPLFITRFTPTSSFIDHPLSTLTLAFSQPMIALSTLPDIQTQHAHLPITLTPSIPGTWRWIDIQTLQFQAQHRLPFSTTYTLSVAQHCTSSIGACLSSPFSHTFSTTPPRVLRSFPSCTPNTLSPFFFLLFDQRISPLAVLSHIRLTTPSPDHEEFKGNDFELLPKNEAEKRWSYHCTQQENAGKWLAFELKQTLTKSTSYTLHVPAGCPSAEGPLTSTHDWSFSFSTYGPLVIESTWPHVPQIPGTNWRIRFSNQLDDSSITKEVVHVSPPIEDLGIIQRLTSKTVILKQRPMPETSYLVTFDTAIKDIYGQSLEPSKNIACFQTSSYPPKSGYLSGKSGMFIMDPALLENPFFPVMVYDCSAIRLQVYQVNADDWSSTNLPFHDRMKYAKGELFVKGIRVCDRVIEMQVERDQPQEYRIFLSPFLQSPAEHVGQLLIIVEPTEENCLDSYALSRAFVCAWIQCTYLSVDVFPDHGNHSLTIWVTDLCMGKPVSEASISNNDKQYFTDKDGLVAVKVPDDFDGRVVVRRGNDTTFVTGVTIHHYNYREEYAWHVFNDRGLYSPNEEVHMKGCIRKLERKAKTCLPVFACGNVKYCVSDSRHNELSTGHISLNNFGTFFLKFLIPDNASLGDAVLHLKYTSEAKDQDYKEHFHKFKIQEFRKPEYEVKSSHYPTVLHYSHSTHNDLVIACASAMYFAGGPLVGAKIKWTVQPKQTHYVPPGKSGFKFGCTHPFRRGFSHGIRNTVSSENAKVKYPPSHLIGKTRKDGKHEVKIEYGGIEEYPCPTVISAQASVIDLTNQAQETITTFLVHPSSYYVGFKLEKMYGHKGQEVKGKVIVCDVDGQLVSQVKVVLLVRGQGKEERIDASGLVVYEDVKDEQEIAITTEEDAVIFSFIPNLAGNYSLTFSVIDSEQRRNMSSYHNFFIGGGCQKKKVRHAKFVSAEHVELIPNKEIYEAGEIAELQLLAPFSPAEGLLILKCNDAHVGENVRFSMQSESHIIALHLEVNWIPLLQVQVELVGNTLQDNDIGIQHCEHSPRPAFAIGNCKLSISPSIHRLVLDIIPKRMSEVPSPGQIIHTSITVKEQASGKAVKDAEVGLILVDESVLTLTGYTVADPLPVFYPEHNSTLRSYHLREKCLLLSSENTQEIQDRMGMQRVIKNHAECCRARKCSRVKKVAGPAISIRSNFAPLAAFFPYLLTDEKGEVEVAVKLPDGLTRYQIWAVAATEQKFGIAESSIIVQLPVMVRPSPPRFLNFSDHPHVNVVLQNQTNQYLTLLVAARAINAMIDTIHSGFSLKLLSGQRVALTFPLDNVGPGTVSLQFVVSTISENGIPLFSDASEVAIPVYSPYSSEAYATYGDVVDKGVIMHTIKFPLNVNHEFGGLDISTSSTALQSLADAVIYLYNYPYECNEQIASRIIGFMSLWDVLGTFSTKDMPSVEEMKSRLRTDMHILKDRQLSCGGWSWWPQERNTHDDPFISLHVSCALVKVSQKNVLDMDMEMLTKAIGYCSLLESHINRHLSNEFWSIETKYALMSYALYIRALYNEMVAQDASELFNRATSKHLTMEACGWLLVAFNSDKEEYQGSIKILLDHIMANVNEASDNAHFVTSFEDDGTNVMLRSNRRTDAILLEALLVADPKSSLCTKLAKGLQAHRIAGRWKSTQENCFALIALDRFLHVYEEQQPEFVANIWLGDQFISCHTHIGRSRNVNQVFVPMPSLLEEIKDKGQETTQLIIQRQGSGRLYYRIGLVYTPLNLLLDAASYGFSVFRSFEGVDSPLHAVRGPTDDVWKMKLGERVKVTLTITTTGRRYHVALVDFLPACCEIINPLLKGSSSVIEETLLISGCRGDYQERWSQPIYGCYSRFGWLEHENLRDERVEAFCSTLWPGVYIYCYHMRVTCKGEFIVPPSKVEEMYSPENFARSTTEKVIVY